MSENRPSSQTSKGQEFLTVQDLLLTIHRLKTKLDEVEALQQVETESLDVNQAASAFEGMMGDSEEADNSQAEGQPEDQQETDEVEYSEESDEPKPRYKVKASGEEVEVELDELIKGGRGDRT